MKIIIMCILLSLFVPGQTRASQNTVMGWGGAKWGMTKQEVADVLNDSSIANSKSLVVMHKNAAFADKVFTAQLAFSPADGNLVSISLLAYVSNGRTGTAKYEEIISYMASRYGAVKRGKFTGEVEYALWKKANTVIDAIRMHYKNQEHQVIGIIFRKKTTEKQTLHFKKDFLDKVNPGEIIMGVWNALPVAIVKRGKEQLAEIDSDTAAKANRIPAETPYMLTKDWEQNYPFEKNNEINNRYRSKKASYGVYANLSPYSGCGLLLVIKDDEYTLKHFPEIKKYDKYKWKEGFYDGCTHTLFDLSGRVYKNSRGDMVLPVPIHRYLKDGTLEIGFQKSN